MTSIEFVQPRVRSKSLTVKSIKTHDIPVPEDAPGISIEYLDMRGLESTQESSNELEPRQFQLSKPMSKGIPRSSSFAKV
jgi:hypothetical protein